MRGFYVKLPDPDAERFAEQCRREGKSCYQVLRELIYAYLAGKTPQPARDTRQQLDRIEQRLEELEQLQRKTHLLLLRLLEEHTGRTTEGPESPAGAVEDEHPARTEPRPRGAVASTSSTDTRPRRGREPQKDIQQATGE